MPASATDPAALSVFARDVRDGLGKAGQKQLPSAYLYDDLGTALFEAITLLPEYGLTRADARLLRRHSKDIAAALPSRVTVAELGSGAGSKTRWILEALTSRGTSHLTYYPIDISRSALAKCRSELETIPGLNIVEKEENYLEGLRDVLNYRGPHETLLVLFLGSTIGNFDYRAAETFLSEIRSLLAAGDALLLGADLEKPLAQLLDAYDDPTGVTAAFNLNILARINRELGADFNLRNFAHEARYDEEERRIEMHLCSKISQLVNIRAARLSIALNEGETIWTEASHKFDTREIKEMSRSAGFECRRQWVDAEWPFAESLLLAI